MSIQLNKIKPYLLLCALFFMAQSAAQLHAMDHLFHNDDPSCMAFHSVQHQSGVWFDHSCSIPMVDASDAHQSVTTYRVDSIHHHFAASRAPPSVC